MLTIAQVLKEKWSKITGFAHSQTTNKLAIVIEAANDSARVSGQIVKNRPLSEPIRLQDLEDSARSQASKTKFMYRENNLDIPGSNQGCWLRNKKW